VLLFLKLLFALICSLKLITATTGIRTVGFSKLYSFKFNIDFDKYRKIILI
jgi:hypothetical protein